MRIRKYLDDLQSNLWFRPVLWVLALGALAIVLTSIDHQFAELFPRDALPWFLQGSAEGGRTILGIISSATLTVASLAFSIMMLVVVQTANAYSPRLLRQFIGDPVNQNALGILIGTFLYSLLVLRGVRSSVIEDFVPLLALNIAIALSLVAVGAFIYFISHVAESIKVHNIIKMVMRRTQDLVVELFPPKAEQGPGQDVAWQPASSSTAVLAQDDGYIQLFALSGLIKRCTEADVVVKFYSGIGDYVVRGTPLATISPASNKEQLRSGVRDAVVLGKERTLVQDVLWGVRQLADIALRALSPAVNDPSTAVTTINALATLLGEVARRRTPSPYHFDDEGTLRVIIPRLDFTQVLDEAYYQIAHYGAGDVHVVLQLLQMCRQIAYIADQPNEKEALWHLAQRVVALAGAQLATAPDRQAVNEVFRHTARILNRDPGPHLLTIASQREPV